MNKSSVIAIIVIVVLGAGAWFYWNGYTPSETGVSEQEEMGGGTVVQAPSKPQIIRYTDSGYTPASLTVEKGAEVTFRNESSRETWPASAMHPTHRVYPGSDINKCGTPAAAGIFDACRGLKPGESWSFRFDLSGTWNYHDHLNPRHFASITVE